MYEGNLTAFGKYCKHYDMDGGKSAEPFFDSIMAQIAIMNQTEFNKYFMYTPVKPITQRKGTNNNNVRNLNNTNLKIYPGGGGVTFKLIKEDTNTVVNRNNIPGYKDGEHIFVFGPISNHTFEYIKTKVTQNKNRNVFIHLQGENGVHDNSGNDVSKDVIGMTPHPGLFNNAFNLQGNLYNALRFRKLMRENATCYTVCLKRDSRGGNVNVGNFQGARLILPTIMKDFYNNIINGYVKSNGPTKNNNNGSTKLNVPYVCQDLYDKDNFVSLDQIVRASRGTPKIHIVGRAFFNRPEFKPLNKMGPPFRNGKMLPGFKGLQFPGGLNASGAHNNNKFNTEPFKYDRVLSSRINKFILEAWKKCSSRLRSAITDNTKVDFMNQNTSKNMNNGRPIAFHENMFVNVVGFWLAALGKKPLSKAKIFEIFSKRNNNNTVNRAFRFATEGINNVNVNNYMA